MKKIVTLFLIGILLIACKTNNESEEKRLDGYTISGTAPGVYNGIRVYLQTKSERGRVLNMDTAIVMDERFKFEGKVENPQLWLLAANSIPGNIPIIVENKAMNVELNKDNIKLSSISGTKANEDLSAYESKLNDLSQQITQLKISIRSTVESDEKMSLAAKFTTINNKISNLPLLYIKENPESLYALVLLDEKLNTKNVDFKNLLELYTNLDSDLKSSKLGQAVAKNLDAKKKEHMALSATEIGKKAPSFTAPTPDGSSLALADALGKVTIIDFWAAWCGPCRRENPNVVNVYNKYHRKGLEIIGVSLDGSSRQKEPKDAWIKAIEQDKLTWNHVSNLNYFNDPVAKAYNITSIPATFILDENGVIIAKNLRGSALEAKIASLLN